MISETESIDSLKLRLKSVNKQKLSKEREVLQLRNKERSLTDELHATRAEVDQLTESLEHLKNQIAQSKHQITMIEMCKVSEDLKIGAHIDVLNEHMRGFQQLFDRDQKELEMRIKEQKEKEAKHLEELREQEKKLAEENERQDREVAAIEEECEAIEKECAVLKKRNNAIMLKLRKKLLEVENTRREVMKRNNVAQMINNKDNN
ncbi:unnamed protein product [Spodoptera littoralis]|uniref:Uncharacterized protein n=1 Tax=Spodoptera littoralis TaxID=7109 RepID=A0A9P0N2M7_SPOLI|nr:unnamed protein product [Spodoptera littoralis]CAH1640192.1 unnamed protein product [Spodoptera littoralis]